MTLLKPVVPYVRVLPDIIVNTWEQHGLIRFVPQSAHVFL